MDEKEMKIYEILERWKELPAPGVEMERRWFLNDVIWTACLSAGGASEGGSIVGRGKGTDSHPRKSLSRFSRVGNS